MTDNITPAELEAWRLAREKATSGEWERWDGHATVLAGPLSTNTPDNARGYRALIGELSADEMECCNSCADTNCEECERPEDEARANAAFIALAANNWLRMIEEITRLQAECDRLEKRLDGHECCGICGALLPYEVLRYGVLGDDASWVCADCIEDNENDVKELEG